MPYQSSLGIHARASHPATDVRCEGRERHAETGQRHREMEAAGGHEVLVEENERGAHDHPDHAGAQPKKHGACGSASTGGVSSC